MIINIIGDCDKRPVLYTVMKVMQTVGDVLLVTSSTRLRRLSDTGENGGHYQNVMVAVTTDGLDDFLDNFSYDLNDFACAIVDNIVSADADVTIYVQGLTQTPEERDMLEYIDKFTTINPYMLKGAQGSMFYNCEKFEAFRNANPIDAKLAEQVAKALAPALETSEANIVKIAMAETKGAQAGAEPQKKVAEKIPDEEEEEAKERTVIPQPKKKGLFRR